MPLSSALNVKGQRQICPLVFNLQNLAKGIISDQ